MSRFTLRFDEYMTKNGGKAAKLGNTEVAIVIKIEKQHTPLLPGAMARFKFRCFWLIYVKEVKCHQ